MDADFETNFGNNSNATEPNEELEDKNLLVNLDLNETSEGIEVKEEKGDPFGAPEPN